MGLPAGMSWEDGHRTGVPLTTRSEADLSVPGFRRAPGDLYTAESSTPAWSSSSG
jgi:hypothetical protein